MTTQARPLLISDLDAETRERIYDHVFASDGAEVGGVLVGDVDATGRALVHGMIPALEADGARASVTFTHDAWQAIIEVQERDFPDSPVIVGWYHSHPGFGIFLSEHDIFIQRNFFREPFQVAYVVDPQDETEGMFGWRDGEVVLFEEGRTPRRRGKRRPTMIVDLDDDEPLPVAGSVDQGAPTVIGPLPELGAPRAPPAAQQRRRRRGRGLIGVGVVAVALAAVGVGLAVSGSGSSGPSSARSGETGSETKIGPLPEQTQQHIAGSRRLVLAAAATEQQAQDAYDEDLADRRRRRHHLTRPAVRTIVEVPPNGGEAGPTNPVPHPATPSRPRESAPSTSRSSTRSGTSGERPAPNLAETTPTP